MKKNSVDTRTKRTVDYSLLIVDTYFNVTCQNAIA